MSKLEDFLSLLQDGTWHSLTQLSKKLSLPTEQLAKISETLSEQGIIQYQEKAMWVRINSEWGAFLSKADYEEVEHKPPVGTVIIPSQESVKIQNVQITNVTGKEVELWIRVHKKFTEIAISKT